MAEYSLTAAQADALLQRLTTDDSFRKLFVDDLTAAFQQLPGAPKPPPDLEPGCCLRPRQLASAESIRATRDALFTTFTQKLGLIPHLLEG